MKLFNLNFVLLVIILKIILFLLSPVKSQEINSSEEKQKLNKILIIFNVTNIEFQKLTEKMSNIKYNVLLLSRFKGLKRNYDSIKKQINYTKNKLDENNYNKTQIIEEIFYLNKTITKFDNDCYSINHAYITFDKTKILLINMIKVFFVTLFIIIIVIFIIIGIISFFVIRMQRRYYILHEENSQDSFSIEKGKYSNNEHDKTTQKNKKENSSSRKVSIKPILSNNILNSEKTEKTTNS